MTQTYVPRFEDRENHSAPPGPTGSMGRSPFSLTGQGPVGMCKIESDPPALTSVPTYASVTPTGEPWMEMAIFTEAEFVAMAKATANYAAPTLDTIDLGKLVREMGISGRATIKTMPNGKKYVVLSGYPGLRQTLTGTRYGIKHAKVVQMGIGPAGIAKSAMKGGGITIVLTVGADILQAVVNDEYLMTSKLGFTIVTDVGKAGIGAAIGYAASMLAAGAASVAAAPVAVGIIVGVGVSLLLDSVYPTEEIVAKMEEQRKKASRAIEDAGRTWNWINTTPEGAMWFMRRFSGY
ncbi:MAG: hypothetical protein KF838_00690 [Phycisphaeraceae bacterium]|nr:MAG: hypothetical protein KF838_00690 [Phycisphaeraceae bacterium]